VIAISAYPPPTDWPQTFWSNSLVRIWHGPCPCTYDSQIFIKYSHVYVTVSS
jgi:hypothetical protein